MKILNLNLLLVIIGISCFSQKVPHKNNELNGLPYQEYTSIQENNILKDEIVLSSSLNYNCNTVFWTVNSAGQIQQWDLISNQVTGGEIVQNNCGSSLSFCGEPMNLTFYSTNWPLTGIKKLDVNSIWVNIPTPIAVLNNGGYGINQFYVNGNNLYHFNGNDLILIDQIFNPNSICTYDTAVDSLGRAWVFTGQSNTAINTLRIYNLNGLVTSLPFNFNGSGSYGSFFINDRLYIGFVNGGIGFYNNVLIPIDLNGTNLTIGNPIPFIDNDYLDMASCNKIISLGIETNQIDGQLKLFPNPTNDKIIIKSDETILSIYIYSIDGKLIKVYLNQSEINISEFENSIYLLKILSEKKVYNKYILKN